MPNEFVEDFCRRPSIDKVVACCYSRVHKLIECVAVGVEEYFVVVVGYVVVVLVVRQKLLQVDVQQVLVSCSLFHCTYDKNLQMAENWSYTIEHVYY